jgi:glycosyltransferase involved in cell wall biosynthesis
MPMVAFAQAGILYLCAAHRRSQASRRGCHLFTTQIVVLRIVIVYQYFGTPAGGWSTRVYEQAKRWVASGAEVTVITSPYYKSDIRAKGFISRQEVDGIKLVVIDAGDSNKISILKRIVRAILFSIVSSWYAVRLPGDVLLASSGPITVGIPALLAKWLTRKKIVFEVRDLWPQGAIEMKLIRNPILVRLGLGFEKMCYDASDLVVPCSRGMEDGILSRYPEVKTLVIENACDVELFGQNASAWQRPDWVAEPGLKLFVYFGSLGVMDACEEILDGFAAMKDRSSVRLVFIGDGSERSALEQQCGRLGLTEQVRFLGLRPKKELIGWVKSAVATFVVFKDHQVLSTSSPNKMFDSFAAGIPIIQNTRGWIRELVDRSGCGINVTPKDPNSMAAAMEAMCSIESADWQRMSDAASGLAAYDFNRTRLADLYLQRMKSLS